MFVEAKEIIERYEDQADVASVRSKVFLDRLADVVLGDFDGFYALICEDCGVHNGLRREDERVEKFVCYRCEHLNVQPMRSG